MLSVDTLYQSVLAQMVAEAYLEGSASVGNRLVALDKLTRGNNRPEYLQGKDPKGYTRFADRQFEELWPADGSQSGYEIVHQVSDDPNNRIPGQSTLGRFFDNTGMSATLLRKRGTNEFTLSIRSTEYRNEGDGGDYLRDGSGAGGQIATDGYAFAQISALEDYYAWLTGTGRLPTGGAAKLTVTGYSLGGHLATVFTEIHHEEIEKTIVFNGAGRGGLAAQAGQLQPNVPLSTATVVALYRAVLADPDAWSQYVTSTPLGSISTATYNAAKASPPVNLFVSTGEIRNGNIYSGNARHLWASMVARSLTTGLLGASSPLSNEANEKIVALQEIEWVNSRDFRVQAACM